MLVVSSVGTQQGAARPLLELSCVDELITLVMVSVVFQAWFRGQYGSVAIEFEHWPLTLELTVPKLGEWVSSEDEDKELQVRGCCVISRTLLKENC